MTNTITFIGIVLSFIVGSAGLVVGLRNSHKTIFINSVTAARIKYLQDIRMQISEFCGLVFNYHTPSIPNYIISKGTEEEKSEYEKARHLTELDIQKRYDILKYSIRLHLNIEDKYFDPKIINLIDQIRELKQLDVMHSPIILSEKIEELILVSQYLLKLEWEGAKLESQKGELSKDLKHKLYNKYKNLHKRKKMKNSVVSTTIDKKIKFSKEQRIIIFICITVGLLLIGLGIGIIFNEIIAGIFLGLGIGLFVSSFTQIYLLKRNPSTS